MAISRSCDLCDKPESPTNFIQHFTMMPSRQIRENTFAARGRRMIDLCGDCADAWTTGIVGTEYRRRKEPEAKPLVSSLPGGCNHKSGHGVCLRPAGHKGQHRNDVTRAWEK